MTSMSAFEAPPLGTPAGTATRSSVFCGHRLAAPTRDLPRDAVAREVHSGALGLFWSSLRTTGLAPVGGFARSSEISMRMDATARRQDSNVIRLKSGLVDPVASQARECLRQMSAAIATLSTRVDDRFTHAVRTLYSVDGHVVVTGLGKSGHVGRKIAATLASMGTPSFFVHSAEALHGDLGMITADSAVILISYSGETAEVVSLLPHLRQRGIPTVALVGNTDSTLARGVDVALDVSVESEVCPNNLAPTSSTLATLAIGDALSVSLSTLRGFHEEDFARLHPAGSLGRRLMRVGDVVAREGVTVITPQTAVRECVLELARSELPLALVHEGPKLVGVLSSAEIAKVLRETPELLAEPRCDLLRDREVVGGRIERDEQVAEVLLVSLREHLASAAPMLVDDEPARDRERPRHHLRSREEASTRAMNLQHRLLDDVFGLRAIARVTEQEAVEPRRELVVDVAESGVLSTSVAVHRRVERHVLLAPAVAAHERLCIRLREAGRSLTVEEVERDDIRERKRRQHRR